MNANANFTMGTILEKGFPQALTHTVHSNHAFGTHAMNCMHLCWWKNLWPLAQKGGLPVFDMPSCAKTSPFKHVKNLIIHIFLPRFIISLR